MNKFTFQKKCFDALRANIIAGLKNGKPSPADASDPNHFRIGSMSMRFRAADGDDDAVAVIDLDGEIGFDLVKWWNGEDQTNTTEAIKQRLRSITAPTILVNINSPGGAIADGISIHDMLKEHPAQVITVLRGMSASAATIIAQAGDIRKQSANSVQLIHHVMAGIMGWFNVITLAEIDSDLQALDRVLVRIYTKRTGKSEAEIRDLMGKANGAGVFLSADEALEMGLIDEIYEPGETEPATTSATAKAMQKAGILPDSTELEEAVRSAFAAAFTGPDPEGPEMDELQAKLKEIKNKESEPNPAPSAAPDPEPLTDTPATAPTTAAPFKEKRARILSLINKKSL